METNSWPLLHLVVKLLKLRNSLSESIKPESIKPTAPAVKILKEKSKYCKK